ncbi:MAG: transglutaminase domain-containing protein [Muribaculaceae bacterium]|nr:transglutaminase domain-containing protein [Muribaculaceae bacterium]
MKKYLILALIVLACIFGIYKLAGSSKAEASNETTPVWLEADSLTAIDARIRADFSLSRDEFAEQVRQNYPDVTDADIDEFVEKHYVEAKTIDGEQRFHRKSPRNLRLLNPAYNGGARHRGDQASAARISYVDSVLQYYRGKNKFGKSHEVTFKYTIDVPYDEALEGDTLSVWMVLPLSNPEGGRQRDLEILSAEPADYVVSGDKSMHSTIYFNAPAPQKGDTAHFEYVARFITSGAYFSEKEIMKNLKPYNKDSEVYKQYTKLPDGRHIVRLDSLAAEIVGNETNPYKCSELVFDYIIDRYPWAGAREYSTISCMPEYVLREKHGDCGQVSLLYISLMRTLGIPARWESGWMLHPHEVNLHDWAEVYLEGIGWVPVDVSFGRYTGATDPEITGFYSHGIDAHRLAANTGVGDKFYPAKKFVRSETVDSQLGEVESTKGNLYYPAWNHKMRVISVTPVQE